MRGCRITKFPITGISPTRYLYPPGDFRFADPG